MDPGLKYHFRNAFEKTIGKAHDRPQKADDCLKQSGVWVLTPEQDRQIAETQRLDNERANGILDELDACFEPTLKIN